MRQVDVNKEAILLEGLLKKNNLNSPVSVEYRQEILKDKKAIYKNVLELSKYGTILGTLIWLYSLILKKLGIGVGISAAKVILVSTLTVTVSAGVYVSIVQLTQPEMEVGIDEELDSSGTSKDVNAVSPIDSNRPDRFHTLGILNLKASGIDAGIIDGMTQDIKNEFVKYKGEDYSTTITGRKESNVKYYLDGIVSRVDDVIHLNIRIINKSTSKIEFAFVREVDSIDELKKVSKKIPVYVLYELEKLRAGE